jgi:hypothetical protein
MAERASHEPRKFAESASNLARYGHEPGKRIILMRAPILL